MGFLYVVKCSLNGEDQPGTDEVSDLKGIHDKCGDELEGSEKL
jgi:hypothetical protein